jgi:hypothetical protein
MRTEKFPARSKSAFQSWRKKHGVTVHDAASLFAVTERCIRNWDKKDAPPLAKRMIQIFTRDLGGLHPSWKGISIKPNGKMYFKGMVGGQSQNVGLSADHIRHYPATINQLHQIENDAHAQARLIQDKLRKLQYQDRS